MADLTLAYTENIVGSGHPTLTDTVNRLTLVEHATDGTHKVIKAVAYKETKVAVAALNIDLATGNYFTKTISTASTFTVSNIPTTGSVASFVLDLTNGGTGTITWWSGMKWVAGTAPTLTASGRDVLAFFTHDAGTTWSGFVVGKDVK
jgi:hypothetical protein